MGQQKAETEQILDLRGTRQRRVADFGGGNQIRLNGPWPSPGYSLQFTYYSLQFTVYSLQFTVYSLQFKFTVYNS